MLCKKDKRGGAWWGHSDTTSITVLIKRHIPKVQEVKWDGALGCQHLRALHH